MVRVLICGGGNGAHCHAGIASSQPGVQAHVLTLYADEAKRWATNMMTHDFEIKVNSHGVETHTVRTKPALVTKDPAKAAVDVDVVVLTVPAFAHAQYLEALKPYIKPGWVLVGLPGQAGFEFQVRGIWGAEAKKVTIIAFESLPWACRIREFGLIAEVLGVKNVLLGAISKGSVDPPEDALAMVQRTMGELPVLETRGHILGMTLMGVNAYIHPCVMYAHWRNWDGKPIKGDAPLIYHGVSEESCEMLSRAGDEVLAIAKAISTKYPDVDLSNVDYITDWFRRCYSEDIQDPSTLYSCFRSNRAYNGLTHPVTMNKSDGTYVPDFKYRYLTEDIPCGLVVLRGIATIAGVPTPCIDEVLSWGQKCMGKEYLVNGELTGKDMKETRSPQAYGFLTMEDVLGK